MSDPVSPLHLKTRPGRAQVTDRGPMGMIQLKGALEDPAFQAALSGVTGGDMPAPRAMTSDGQNTLCWMAPDEVMVLSAYPAAPDILAQIDEAMRGMHVLAANVSDARVVIRVQGAACRDVLAKLTPADISPDAFAQGQFRRSRLAQVAAAFWMVDTQTIDVMCFRSVATYVFDLLANAARPESPVGYFADI